MEGFDKNSTSSILFMGATNVPWQLDPAVLRPGRFDERVYSPLPDLPARQKLLEIHLGKRPIAADVHFADFAQQLDGYSGADIKYICDRAATIPFLKSVATGQEGDITAEILLDAMHETPRSVNAAMLARFDQWQQSAASA